MLCGGGEEEECGIESGEESNINHNGDLNWSIVHAFLSLLLFFFFFQLLSLVLRRVEVTIKHCYKHYPIDL